MSESSGSPHKKDGAHPSLGVKEFLHPSPIITKRTRTKSMSERAAEGPSFKGVVKSFCRQRGHGFIHPEGDQSEDIFVHISE
ncbi:calcium-regulated heat stable protein 1 [Elysia marginata]|uniref:Calcium-regulated heat stable protein 1 n=1 Tax=Elysia marginata TaxID=1093978 RepID=A0AAV4H4B2_9GAST|nr:calcium-regulated heat stable protein 1 [Elysia marginata]